MSFIRAAECSSGLHSHCLACCWRAVPSVGLPTLLFAAVELFACSIITNIDIDVSGIYYCRVHAPLLGNSKLFCSLFFHIYNSSPLRKRSCLDHSQLFSPQRPTQNCRSYFISIYPVMDKCKPGSLSTYLGGRPHLPPVVAMSQHSEKTAPPWRDSGNLGGERNYMSSFPHRLSRSSSHSHPKLPPCTLSLGQPHPQREKMPDGRGKPSHPCKSPFLLRGSAHLPKTCPFPVPPPLKSH